MRIKKIDLKKIIEGKETYPSWTTNSVYPLEVEGRNDTILIYFKIRNGRIVSREFPRHVALTPKFCYALGLIKGEGANSLGKSNYRRFTLTNPDPGVIKFALSELENSNFLSIDEIPYQAFHLLHFKKNQDQVVNYWSKVLQLSP